MPVAHLHTPVGWLEITATQAAIESVHMMDEDPATPLPPENPLLELAAAEMLAYFEGHLQVFSFPIAQTGTDFQQRVWDALTHIPFGKTISYKTLALRLGDEKCIRAAGTANGRNKLAIVVPCHRVIGANGTLVGYAGGLWRKQWLLEHESKFGNGVSQQQLF